jgi:hypothetical protein
MPPTSYTDLGQQTVGLIGRAFSSAGNLVVFLFEGFIRVSPLPDEVDFLLICMLFIWLTSMLIRVIRGKQS